MVAETWISGYQCTMRKEERDAIVEDWECNTRHTLNTIRFRRVVGESVSVYNLVMVVSDACRVGEIFRGSSDVAGFYQIPSLYPCSASFIFV